MKTATAGIRKALTAATVAAALLAGFQPPVRAAAEVIKGEMVLPAWLPFYTVPDDPSVDVFCDMRCDVRFSSDGAGGLHILVKEIKEALPGTSSVVSPNYDYELLDVRLLSASPNNVNQNGLFAGTIRYFVAFIRFDQATGTPLALITGEGLGHLTQQGDALTPGEVIVMLEKMGWTTTPIL